MIGGIKASLVRIALLAVCLALAVAACGIEIAIVLGGRVTG
jgi:hypothetical protein